MKTTLTWHVFVYGNRINKPGKIIDVKEFCQRYDLTFERTGFIATITITIDENKAIQKRRQIERELIYRRFMSNRVDEDGRISIVRLHGNARK